MSSKSHQSLGIRALLHRGFLIVLLVASSFATLLHAEPLAHAELTDAEECLSADGIWVIVEDDEGVFATGCAKEPTNGVAALKQIRVAVNQTNDGWQSVCEISGRPAGMCNKNNGFNQQTGEYWTYWHGTTVNGSISWKLSDVMASNYVPPAGTIEGWRWGDGKIHPALENKLIAPQADEQPSRSTDSNTRSVAVPTMIAVAILVIALVVLGLKRRNSHQLLDDEEFDDE